jgi:hypothetical protein
MMLGAAEKKWSAEGTDRSVHGDAPWTVEMVWVGDRVVRDYILDTWLILSHNSLRWFLSWTCEAS